MFRVPDKPFGLGNLSIWLSQVEKETKVSNIINRGMRSKYLNFLNLNIVEDDGIDDSIEVPPIYINDHTIRHVHPNIRNKISPTPFMTTLIEDNIHLITECTVGLAIRTGNHSFINRVEVDFETDENKVFYNTVHADNTGLYKFENIIRSITGNVFVSCDNLRYKHHLTDMFGPRVKYVDRESIMVSNGNSVDEYSSFLEFFLLGKCPRVYLTGGPKDTGLSGFSTFGYMAAIYGNVPFSIVFND